MALPREKFIGTSLRGCVRDIVDSNHRIDDVDHIIAPTEFRTRDEVLEYVTRGSITQKERMAEVAGKLWDDGRIAQPRIEGGEKVSARTVRLWYPARATAPRVSAAQLF